jgi:hypothetical protein
MCAGHFTVRDRKPEGPAFLAATKGSVSRPGGITVPDIKCDVKHSLKFGRSGSESKRESKSARVRQSAGARVRECASARARVYERETAAIARVRGRGERTENASDSTGGASGLPEEGSQEHNGETIASITVAKQHPHVCCSGGSSHCFGSRHADPRARGRPRTPAHRAGFPRAGGSADADGDPPNRCRGARCGRIADSWLVRRVVDDRGRGRPVFDATGPWQTWAARGCLPLVARDEHKKAAVGPGAT